jgi:hypothetical protein
MKLLSAFESSLDEGGILISSCFERHETGTDRLATLVGPSPSRSLRYAVFFRVVLVSSLLTDGRSLRQIMPYTTPRKTYFS